MEILYLIKDFLINTPWYIYLILLYLIKIGIRYQNNTFIHIRKLFIIPCIFIIMSINEFITHIKLEPIYLTSFVLGLIIGSIFGYWQFKNLILSANKQTKILCIKGSSSTITLFITTFCVKYYIGYSLAIQHSMSVIHVAVLLFISTIFTGLFFGRFICSLYKLKI